MRYMLDSNICIYIINRKPQPVLSKLNDKRHEGLAISAITLAELEHGISLSEHQEKNRNSLSQFLAIIDVLDFDVDAAHTYGDIRASLQRKGQLIGPLDLLIAAHAKSKGLILVTNNTDEFSRVDGLSLENWV